MAGRDRRLRGPPRLPRSLRGPGTPRDARDRPHAARERPHGTPPLGRGPRRARRGPPRREGERRSGDPGAGPPRRGRLRREPRRPRTRGGLPPRRPRPLPSGRGAGLPPGPRLGVPEPRDSIRQNGPPRPGLRHVHEGPGCPRRRRRLGRRRGGMGGPGPAPAGDPGCRPMAGRPRRGDRVLRPRGDEGEGGAPPWDAREETRVTVGPAHATRWPRHMWYRAIMGGFTVTLTNIEQSLSTIGESNPFRKIGRDP